MDKLLCNLNSVSSVCKESKQDYNKRHRLENIEMYNMKDKLYVEANKEKVKQR